MDITQAAIRLDTSAYVKTQITTTFDNLTIENISHGSTAYFGDRIPKAIVFDESNVLVNDTNTLTIAFNNWEISNNVNFAILSC